MGRAPTHTFWCANRSRSFARVLEPFCEGRAHETLTPFCSHFGAPSPCSKRTALPGHGLRKTVAFTGENHNMAVVDWPVNQSCRQPVVSKDGVPLRKLQVGGNNQALALVAVRNHLEQQLGCILVQRYKANFVNHNQLHLFQRAEEVVESAFVVLLEQEIGKTGCGKEPHFSPLLASFQGNSRCKMCLTCTNRSHKNQVFLGGEKVQISHIFLR